MRELILKTKDGWKHNPKYYYDVVDELGHTFHLIKGGTYYARDCFHTPVTIVGAKKGIVLVDGGGKINARTFFLEFEKDEKQFDEELAIIKKIHKRGK